MHSFLCLAFASLLAVSLVLGSAEAFPVIITPSTYVDGQTAIKPGSFNITVDDSLRLTATFVPRQAGDWRITSDVLDHIVPIVPIDGSVAQSQVDSGNPLEVNRQLSVGFSGHIVLSFKPSGASEFAKVASGLVLIHPNPPVLRVAGVTPTSITLEWDDVDGAISYTVWIDGNDSERTTDASITFDELDPGTEYRFISRSSAGLLTSVISAPLDVTTLAVTPLSATITYADDQTALAENIFAVILPFPGNEVNVWISPLETGTLRFESGNSGKNVPVVSGEDQTVTRPLLHGDDNIVISSDGTEVARISITTELDPDEPVYAEGQAAIREGSLRYELAGNGSINVHFVPTEAGNFVFRHGGSAASIFVTNLGAKVTIIFPVGHDYDDDVIVELDDVKAARMNVVTPPEDGVPIQAGSFVITDTINADALRVEFVPLKEGTFTVTAGDTSETVDVSAGDVSESTPKGTEITVGYEFDDNVILSFGGKDAARIHVTTGPTPLVPSAPSLRITGTTHDTVTLSWDAVHRADTYTLTRTLGSNPAVTVLSGIADLTFTDKNLAAETDYTYSLTAINSVGPSEPSEDTVTTDAAPTPPDTPTLVAGVTTHNTVSLSWNEPTDADRYILTRTAGTVITEIPVTGGTHTDDALKSGVQYTYSIRAVSAIGASADSNDVTVDTIKVPVLSTTPTYIDGQSAIDETFEITIVDDNTIAVSFDAKVDGEYYVVWGDSQTSPASIVGGNSANVEIIIDNYDGAIILFFDIDGDVDDEDQEIGSQEVARQVVPAVISPIKDGTLSVTDDADGIITVSLTPAFAGTFSVSTNSLESEKIPGVPDTQIDITLDVGHGFAEDVLVSFNNIIVAGIFVTTVPDAPALVLGPVTSTSITLSWNSVDNADSYTLTRIVADGDDVTVFSGDALTATDDNLSPDAEYRYAITATTPEGRTGAISAELAVDIGSAVESFGVIVDGDGASVSFTPLVPGDFTVGYGDDPDNDVPISVAPGKLSAKLTAIKVGYNFNGPVTLSLDNDIIGRILIVTEPPPTTLDATAVTDTSITLAWPSQPEVQEYRLYRNGALVVATGELSYTDTGLDSNTAYTYHIESHNDVSTTSDRSADLDVTTLIEPPRLVAGEITTTSVELTWDAVDGAHDYFLYRDGVDIASVTGTTHKVTELAAGTEYSFTAESRSIDSVTSPLSSPLSVRTVPDTPALRVTGTTFDTITLSWGPVNGAASYTLTRVVEGDDVTVFSGDALTATDENLSPATSYNYIITATTSGGTSAPSAEFAASTASAVPIITTSSQIVNTPSITIAGTAESGKTVELFQGETSAGTTTADGTGAFSFEVTLADGANSFTATASDGTDTSAPSSPVVITLDTEKPLITVLGSDETIELTAADTYAEPGATVEDNDPAYSEDVTVAGNTPDTSVIRVYTVTYNAPADAAGNEPDQQSIVITVSDTTPPTFDVDTNTDDYSTLVPFAGTYTQGIITNAFDISGIASGTVGGESVNVHVSAEYAVTYTVTDNNGQAATITETVTVEDDEEKPVITPLGSSETIIVSETDTYTEPGATVKDNDPTYAGTVTVAGDTPDTSVVGEYTVTYTAPPDAAGNIPDEKSIVISIVDPPTSPPATIRTLSVSSTTHDSITLSWDAVATAASYTVTRIVNGGANDVEVFSGDALTATDEGLAPETTYRYTITATNSAGSSTSLEFSLNTAAIPAAPAAPVLSVTSATDTTVSFSWGAVEGADSYTLTRVVADGSDVPVPTTPELTATDENLAPETSYNYIITATNAGGTTPSATFEATTSAPPAPATPVFSTVVSATHNSINLSWSAVAGADSYTLTRVAESGNNVRVFSGDALTFTNAGLDPDTAYNYIIMATNSAGTSEPSDPFTATTSTAPPTLVIHDTPTLVTGIITYNTVSLSWGESTGADSYILTRTAGTDTVEIPVTGGTTVSYTDDDVKPSTTYTYSIKAVSASGDSADSNDVIATTIPVPILSTTPTYAVDQSAIVGTSFEIIRIDDDTITVSFDAINDGEYYAQWGESETSPTTITGGNSASVQIPIGDYAGVVILFFEDNEVARQQVPAVTSPIKDGTLSVTDDADGIITVSLTPAFAGAFSVGTHSLDSEKILGVPDTTIVITLYVGHGFAENVFVSFNNIIVARVFVTTVPETPALVLGAVTDTSIALSWGSVDNADRYTLTRTADGTDVIIVSGNVLTFTDEGLAAGTNYVYAITATTPEGRTSATSADLAVTIGSAAQSFDVIADGDDASISFTPLVPGDFTIGYGDDSSNDIDVPIAAEDVGEPSTSTVQVGYNFNGPVTLSLDNDIIGRILIVTEPPPTTLDATAVTDTSITLAWSSQLDVHEYQLYRNGALVVATGELSYTDTGLAAATVYTYHIESHNDVSTTSDRSADLDVTTLIEPPRLVAGEITTTSVELTWDAVDGAHDYFLYRDGVDIASVTGTTHKVTELAAGTEYSFTAESRSIDSVTSPLSSPLSVRTVPDTPALRVTGTTFDTITLSWSPVNGAASYTLTRVVEGDDVTVFSGDALTATDENLSPATSYNYIITATTSGGTSAPSAEFAASTASAVPIITTSSQIVNTPSITIAGTTESGKTVELFQGETSAGTTTADGTGNFSFEVTLADGANSFTATASDGTDTSAPSSPVVITLDTIPPIITVDPLTVTLPAGSSQPDLLAGVSTDDNSPVTTTGTVNVNTPGDYTITYDSTDGTNAAVSATRTYAVTAMLEPFVTVVRNDDNSITVTWRDIETDDGTYFAVVENTNSDELVMVGTGLTGNSHTFSDANRLASLNEGDRIGISGSTDGSINLDTLTFVDTEKPVITVLGSSDTIDVSEINTYTVPDATVTDNDPAYFEEVAVSGDTPDTSVIGVYTVTYTAPADAAGNKPDPQSVVISVVDPSISIGITYTEGQTAIEEGSFSVLVDSVFTDKVFVRFEPKNKGTYTAILDGVTRTVLVTEFTIDNRADIPFDYEDSYIGNIVLSFDDKEVARQTVMTGPAPDTIAPPVPIITTSSETVGLFPIIIEGGSTESGATVELFNGGTSVGTTTADGSGNFSFTVVVLTEGANSFTATASDGPNTSEASPAVVITLDTEKPVITVLGSSETIKVSETNTYTERGATVDDNDPAYSGIITVTGNIPDTRVVGKYTVTYTAPADAAGNAPDQQSIIITVNDSGEDTTPPVITVNPPIVTLPAGLPQPDLTAGVSTDDNSPIITSGTVDTGTPGNYPVTYDSTDASGNDAVPATRTYTVSAPEYALTGAPHADGDKVILTFTSSHPGDFTLERAGSSPVDFAIEEGHTAETITEAVGYDYAGDIIISIRYGAEVARVSVTTGPESPTESPAYAPGQTAIKAGSFKVEISPTATSVTFLPLMPGNYTVTLADLPPQTKSFASDDAGKILDYMFNLENHFTGDIALSFDGVNVVTHTVTIGSPTLGTGDITDTSIRIEWDSVDDNADYILFRIADDDSATELATTTELTATDENLAADTGYTYAVRAAVGATSVLSDRFDARTAVIPDDTPPVITANPRTVTLPAGSPQPDLLAGVTTDDGSPVITSRTINIYTPGNYVIIYDSADASGNAADPVTRIYTVTVVIEPFVTVVRNADNSITVIWRDIETDDGTYSVVFKNPNSNHVILVGTGLTGNSHTFSDVVNLASLNEGDRIGVAGSAGGSINFDTLTFADTEKPVITVLGSTQTIDLTATDTYAEPGATVDDNDPDYSKEVTVTGDTPDTSVIGVYTVTYNAPADVAGNIPDEKSIVITVSDITPPAFEVDGNTDDYSTLVPFIGTYAPGVIANKSDISGIASSVVGGDSVDVNTSGEYVVTYTVTDSNGNSATITETVTVGNDEEKPVITVLGSSETIAVSETNTYTEPGATVTDNDPAYSGIVTVTGNAPDTRVKGEYTVLYNAPADAAGNIPDQQSIIITVNDSGEDTTPPVIAVDPPTVTLPAGLPQPDLTAGVSTDDNSPVVTSGTVNTIRPGNYTVTYDSTDASGNDAVSAIRTYTVSAPEYALTSAPHADGDKVILTFTSSKSGDFTLERAGSSPVDFAIEEGRTAETITEAVGYDYAGDIIISIRYGAEVARVSVTTGPALIVTAVRSPDNAVTLTWSNILGADYAIYVVEGGVNVKFTDSASPYHITIPEELARVDDSEGNQIGVAGITDGVSGEITFTTVPPKTPALDFTSTGTGITLSWDAVNGADSYTVTRVTESGNADVPITGLTATDESLTAGTEYRYTITSTSGELTSHPSAQFAATTLAAPQTVPTYAPDQTAIKAGSFKVEISPTATLVTFLPLMPGDYTVTLTDLPPKTRTFTSGDTGEILSYVFNLENHLTGDIALSFDGVNVVTHTVTIGPPTLGTGDITDTSIRIEWDSVNDNADYALFRIADDNFGIELETTAKLTATDKNLAADTGYTYAVRAAVGATSVLSDRFDARTAVIPDDTPPVITANPRTVTLPAGSPQPDLLAGVTTDDGSPVTASGAVNTDTPRNYVIIYDSADASGNAADPVTRIYAVTIVLEPFVTVVRNDDNSITVIWRDIETSDGTYSVVFKNPNSSLAFLIRTGLTGNSHTFSDAASIASLNKADRIGVSDGAGGSINFDTLTYTDAEKPVITVLGSTQTIDLTATDTYAEPGATVDDNDPDYSEEVTVTGDTPDTSVIGEYTVLYNAPADVAGNIPDEKSIVITISDITPPTFDVDGNTDDYSTRIPFGGTYAPGKIANKSDISGIASGTVGGKSVNVHVSAEYAVTYTVTDNNGQAATITETVTVGNDEEKPVITVLGSSETIAVSETNTYTEPGATVTDNDPAYSGIVTVTGNAPDTRVIGEYTVLYNAPADAAGNIPEQKSIIITVNDSGEDTTPPVIAVDPPTVILQAGSAQPVLLEGVTTNDNFPVTTSGNVDIDTPDDYIITYDSTDASGNDAVSAIRTYTVSAPVETITGVPTYAAGQTAIEAGSFKVEIRPTFTLVTFNPLVSGDYTVTLADLPPQTKSFSSDDAGKILDYVFNLESHFAGDIALSFDGANVVTHTVTTGPPALRVGTVTDTSIRIEWDSVDDDADYTMLRITDDNLGIRLATTAKLTATDEHLTADTEYTYAVRATVGATSVLSDRFDARTDVPPDIEKPVITVLGSSEIIKVSETNTYVELGATVTDNDPAYTGIVTVSGDPNTSVAGEYTVTYTAPSDAAGNIPEQKSIVITVRDTIAPAVPAINPLPATVNTPSFTIEGTAEAGTTITLFNGATPAGTVIADGSGSFSFAGVELSEGANSFTATASDGVNTSGPSPAIVITLDTETPPVPAITTPSETVSSSSFTIEGTAEAGTTVELFNEGSTVDTITADGDGNFSFAGVALNPGANTFTVTASDGPNTSDASSPVVITLDTETPAVPIITTSPATVNTPSFTIEGTAEAGTTVELFKGVTPAGTTTADSGSFSFTVTLTKGENSFTVTASDGPNTSDASSPVVITLDTEKPVITVLGSTQRIELTATNTYTEPGATVKDNDPAYSEEVTVSGTPDTSVAGKYTVTYTAPADAAGNTPDEKSIVITVSDTTPPTFDVDGNTVDYATAVPFGGPYTPGVITNQSDISGTAPGIVGGDSINVNTSGEYVVTYTVTDNNGLFTTITETVTVESDVTAPAVPAITTSPATVGASPITIDGGSTEAGATIELFNGATSAGTVIADGSGNFSFPRTVLSEGANSFTATASDGPNTSDASSPVVITLDTIPPEAPAITTSPATVDTPSITIEGTAEAGTIVELFKGGTSTGDTVTADSGAFSFTVTLTEGANSFTATATDGPNTSDASPAIVITLDTIAPVITVDKDSFSVELGETYTAFTYSANDNTDGDITDNVVVGDTVDTSVDNTYTVTFDVDDAAGNHAVTVTRTVTVTPDATVPTITVNEDSLSVELGGTYELFTFTANDNTDGIITGEVAVAGYPADTDTAGTYDVTFDVDDAAGNHAVTVARTVTVTDTTAPVITPAGSTQTIELTQTNTYTEQGAIVTDNDPVYTGTVAVTGATPDTRVVKEYTVTYTAPADAAGNTPDEKSIVITVVDTTAPEAPEITTSPATVNTPSFTIEGTAEAGTTVELFNEGSTVDTITADGDGNFSFAGVALDEGENSFTVTASDGPNTSASSSPVLITLDTTAPEAPEITTSPATVNTPSITIEGTAEAGTTVELLKGGTSTGDTVTADSGSFSFAVTLTDGANSFTATASDGPNTSAASSPVVITLDTETPAVPIITTSPATVNTPSITIEGTAEAGTTVELFKGVTPAGTTTADSGSFSFTVTLTKGENSFTATASDGPNTSDASPAVVITLDTIPPEAPEITTSPATVGSSSFTIDGTAEAGSTVELFRGVTSVDTVTDDGDGNFSFTVTLTDGENSFTATASDGPNTSDASPAVLITLDTISPSITVNEDSISVELGETYTPFTFTAADNTDGDITDDVVVGDTVDTNAANTYTVTFDVDDAAGNPAVTVTRTVTVTDTTPPVITPTGSTQRIELTATDTYTEQGAAVTDNDPAYSGTVAVSGDTPDTSSIGVYTVLYDAPDDAANNTPDQQSIVITVSDTTPPTFDVDGNTVDYATTVPFGGPYTQGIITNQSDISGTAPGIVGGETVNVNTSGEYAVTYTVTDNNGLFTTITETVTVESDVTAPAVPAITTSPATVGASPITIDGGSTEAGATITLFNGATSAGTVIADGSGNFSFPRTVLSEGANSFTATASDGPNTSDASSPVLITLDTIAPAVPEITTSPATVNTSSFTIEGTAEAGTTVELFNEGSTVDTITADSGSFSFTVTLTEGANSFTATATDGPNTSDASSPVVITLDTEKPVITVLGSTRTSELTATDTYTEQGATVKDNDPDYSETATPSGNTPDTSVVGVYTVLYDAPPDAAGNTPDQKSIVISVVDTTPPTFDVDGHTGDYSTAVPFGGTYTPGVINNQSDISGTAPGTVGGETVNVNASGEYVVTYTVTDNNGLFATITETVTVESDVTPPIITVTPEEITLELNSPAPVLLDGVTTDDGSTITTSGNVDVTTVGDYTITYSSTDGTNPADDKTRIYKVTAAPDTTEPTELPAPPTLVAGTITETRIEITWDAVNGAKFYSLYRDGNLITTVLDSALGDNLSYTDDVLTSGTSYTYHATSTNDAGTSDNSEDLVAATTIASTENPSLDDTEKPVITPAGSNTTIELTAINTYNIPGATVTDNDPNYSETVTVSGDTPDTSVIGVYTVTYTAPADAAGNTPDEKSIVISVVDTTPPTFDVDGNTADYATAVPFGGPYTLGVIANQSDISGIVSSDVGGETVNVDTSGDYVVTYTVTDNNGLSTIITETVTVESDVTAPPVPAITTPPATVNTPSITIEGTAEVGTTVELFNEGSTVDTITADGDGNFSFAGVALDEGANSFTARASDGVNTSGPSPAIVITLDTTPPVITVDPLTVTLQADSLQPDSLQPDLLKGVSADDGSTVTTTGNVDVNTQGDYDITYDSVDASDNAAESVTRTYTVPAQSTDDTDSGDGGITSVTPGTEKPKKKGGDSNEWKTKPTFGKHWNNQAVQLVDNGFVFNGMPLTITNNWHTDFNMTNSIIGDNNTVHIKGYATNGLKSVSLSLGVPEVGLKTNAESHIIVNVNSNYTSPAGYDIADIVHEQKEVLVNEDMTSASIDKVKCTSSDTAERCFDVTISFVIMAPLSHEVLAINAVDKQRYSTTTYINEGVEFTGEALLAAATHELKQKHGNQNPFETISLTQQDRRYQVWEDQYGYIWSQNDYGTWLQITRPDIQQRNDLPTSVMTRIHSNFASLVIDEQDRATLIFDSKAIQGILEESFSYDMPLRLDRVSDPALLESLSIQEMLAQEMLCDCMIYDDSDLSWND